MTEEKDEISIWCNNVAALGIDVLLHCKIIKEEDAEKATEIVAEEILVRLTIGDYPPPIK